ncbi:MAG: tetratricopeptide repeat protein [Dermatophilaceae bacterium]
MNAFDRYRYAQRLFRERRYTAAARELEHLVMDKIDMDKIDHDTQGPPDHSEPYTLGDAPLLLARSYYHSAQLGRAEKAARALVEADPTDVYAVLLLARTLQRQGRHADAGTWLRRLDAMGYDTWAEEFSPVASEEPVMPPRPEHTHAA